MKKLLLALVLMVPMLAFTGCGGDEPQDTSLNNTKWVMASIGGAQYAYNVFEFKSSSFECYTADSNLTPLGEIINGSYSINGSEINFNGFIMRTGISEEIKFDKGSINGNKIVFNVKFRTFNPFAPNDKTGEWYDRTKTVTLIKH